MLFNTEIEDLRDDGFEGSHDEHRIFREVFFGIDCSGARKRCLVTGVINFECDSSKNADASLCSNSDNSAVTSPCSSRYLCLEDSEPFASVDGSDQSANAKRIKVSGNDLLDTKSERGSSLNAHPSADLAFQTVPLHLVESSSQGITTSSYLLKQHVDKSREVYLGDPGVEKTRLPSLDNRINTLFGGKTIASPASQESFATKLIGAGSSISFTEKPESPSHLKDGSNGELNLSDICLKIDPKEDPRPLLHKHVVHLLRDAGWRVEKRKRPCRKYMDTIYISPEGRKFREFPNAWISFGKVLMADHLVMENDTKKWSGISDFWSDLSVILLEIGKNASDSEVANTLALRYSILDPYVTVVFIDRKIGSLRKGNEVKASQILVRDKSRKDNVVSFVKISDDSGVQFSQGQIPAQLCDPSLAPKSILTLLPTYESSNLKSSVSQQYTDSPISEKQTEMPKDISGAVLVDAWEETDGVIEGQVSDNVKHHNGCKGDESASPELVTSGVIQNSCPCEEEEVGKCIGASEFKTEDKHFGDDVILEKKVYRKSKKISEIKQTLQQSDVLGSNSPSTPENQDVDMGGIHLISRESHDESLNCNEINSLCGISKKGRRKATKCRIQDDDLLVSAIMRSKDYSCNGTGSNHKKKASKSKARKKKKNNKGGCRLLPRSSGKGKKQFTEGKWFMLGPRTVLTWLIATNVISLEEVIQFRNPMDDSVVKTGLVTRDGIVCTCCNRTISLSDFKSHSGFNQNRPCLNLVMESGKPFTLCQLQAWSAEYKMRRSGRTVEADDDDDPNDDSCGLCGEGGELICCDNCPSTYHQACLSMQVLPEGSWYCSNCTCWICGELVNDKEDSTSSHAFRCSQCEHKYHEVCLQGKSIHKGPFPETGFCGGSCEEVYTGLSSHVGVINHIANGLSWTLLRCIHEDQKVHSAQRFAMKAECNSKLAVALSIMEECFQSMVDPRTGIDMIPHVLYNWGSNFARLNFQGFYSVVVEKDDVLISVASIRVHGTTVAEMPLIATCSNYRRQGMCKLLMTAIEEMLMTFKVEKLIIAALPILVDTWTEGFGFKPVEEQERETLKRVNLMVFPGTILLKKTLYEPPNPNTQMGDKPPSGVEETTKVGLCLDEESNGNPCSNESDTKMELLMGENLHDFEIDGKLKLEDTDDGPPPGFPVPMRLNQSTESDGNCCPNESGSNSETRKLESAKQQGDFCCEVGAAAETNTNVSAQMEITPCDQSGDVCVESENEVMEGESLNLELGKCQKSGWQEQFSKISCEQNTANLEGTQVTEGRDV